MRAIRRNHLAVRGIVRKGNKFLMVKRAESKGRGMWQFAGGKCDMQKPMTALHRELKEETGLSVTKAKRRFIQWNPIIKAHTYYYDVRAKGRIKLQKSELSDHRWVTKSQAKNLNLTHGAKKIVRRI